MPTRRSRRRARRARGALRSSRSAVRPARADGPPVGAAGLAGPARQPARPPARRQVDRRPARAVARRPRPPRRRCSHRAADARLDRHAARRRSGTRSPASWSRGAPVDPEQSFVRVLNGFAGAIDPTFLPTIERDPAVAGVYPVRAAYPAALPRTSLDSEAFGAASGRRVGLELPGFDGTGVTVAQLDTGVDLRHPYLQGRLLHGIDILDADGDPSAEQNPTEPGRPERHGTGLAGLVAGVRGPAGLHGVAPGASLLPIRVAGWQPDADGGVSVYGRTDQVLAGLEAAVDPNADGDAHDARTDRARRRRRALRVVPGQPARAGRTRGARPRDARRRSRRQRRRRPAPATAASPRPAGTSARSVSRHRTRGARAPPSTSSSAQGSACSRPARRRSAARPGRTTSSPPPSWRCPRRQAVAVTEGNALDRLFDSRRLQPRGGRRRAPPVRADDARGGAASSPLPARARSSSTARSLPGSLGVDEPVAGADRRHRRGARGRGAARPGCGRPGRARRRRRRLRRQPRARRGRAVLEHGPRARRQPGHGGRRPRRRARDVGSRPQRGGSGALRHAQRIERRSRGRRGLGGAPRRGTARSRCRGPARRACRVRASRGGRRRARHRRPGRGVVRRAGRRPADCSRCRPSSGRGARRHPGT